MDHEVMECPICLMRYNNDNREPKVSPGCGHTLCSSCIKEIMKGSNNFECPFCKHVFKTTKKKGGESLFLKNFAIAQLIDENPEKESSKNLPLCVKHNLFKELVCVDCIEYVCYKCAFHPLHKSHNIEMEEDFFGSINSKVQELKSWRSKMEEHNQNIARHILLEQSNIELIAKLILNQALLKINEIFAEFQDTVAKHFDSKLMTLSPLYT